MLEKPYKQYKVSIHSTSAEGSKSTFNIASPRADCNPPFRGIPFEGGQIIFYKVIENTQTLSQRDSEGFYERINLRDTFGDLSEHDRRHS